MEVNSTPATVSCEDNYYYSECEQEDGDADVVTNILKRRKVNNIQRNRTQVFNIMFRKIGIFPHSQIWNLLFVLKM